MAHIFNHCTWKFKASLVYRTSSKTSMATQRKSVLRNKTKTKTNINRNSNVSFLLHDKHFHTPHKVVHGTHQSGHWDKILSKLSIWIIVSAFLLLGIVYYLKQLPGLDPHTLQFSLPNFQIINYFKVLLNIMV